MLRYWFRVCSSSEPPAAIVRARPGVGCVRIISSRAAAPLASSAASSFRSRRPERGVWEPRSSLTIVSARDRCAASRGGDRSIIAVDMHAALLFPRTRRAQACSHATIVRALARWLVAATSEPPRRPADAVALGQYVGRLHVCRSSNVSTGFPLRRAQRDVVCKSPSIRSARLRSRRRMWWFASSGPRRAAHALCERGTRQ
jgi:hypothetical protein